MHPIIESQLKKVKKADLSNKTVSADNQITSWIIPKHIDLKVETNEVYIIELSDSLLTESATFALNIWNHGKVPPAKILKACVNAEISGMISIDGLAYDPVTQTAGTDLWSGWLPLNDLKIISKF